MVGMAGLYTGAIASEERWQARRAEARAAFTEFMRDNPQASYEDYRSFINSVTEGNSFLRGGIAPDRVLQGLAERRATEYANQQMQQRLQTMSAQAQLSGQLDALAGRYALDIDDDEKMAESLATSLGYDPKNPQTSSILDLVKRTHPTGYGGIRSQVRQEMFDKQLPMVEKLITNNPNLTDDEVLQLVPGLAAENGGGSRKKLIGELLSTARNNQKAAIAKAKQERVGAAIKDARTQIDATGKYAFTGLAADEMQEAEAGIAEYYKGYQQKQDEERRRKAREAMAAAAQTYLAVPGRAESLASDPDRQREYADFLRRSATAFGVEPHESDLQFFTGTAVQQGSRDASDRDERLNKEYTEQLDKALTQPGMRLDLLPLPPAGLSANGYTRAQTIFRDKQQQLLNAEDAAKAEKRKVAVNTVITSVLGDQVLLDKFKRGDIKQGDRDQIVAALRREQGFDPSPESVTEVFQTIQSRIDALQSSDTATAAQTAQTAAREAMDEMLKPNMAALADIVIQRAGKDGEATEASTILNAFVQTQLFDKSSGRVPTSEAMAMVAPYLTADLVEQGEGDFGKMWAILSGKPGFADAFTRASRMPTNSLFELGFPNGDRQLSKQTIVKGIPDKAVANLSSIESKVSQALATLSDFAKRDDPSTTADSTEPSNAFNNALLQATNDAKGEVAAIIRQIEKFQSTSDKWSSDGAITPDEVAAVRTRLAAKLKQTLQRIDEAQKQGVQLIKGFGVTEEDRVMGGSERVDGHNRPSTSEKFFNSPGYQFLQRGYDALSNPMDMIRGSTQDFRENLQGFEQSMGASSQGVPAYEADPSEQGRSMADIIGQLNPMDLLRNRTQDFRDGLQDFEAGLGSPSQGRPVR